MLNDRIDAFIELSEGEGGVFRLNVGVGTTAADAATDDDNAFTAAGEFEFPATPPKFRDLAVPGVAAVGCCCGADAILDPLGHTVK